MRAIIVFTSLGCMLFGPFTDVAAAQTYADNNIDSTDDETTWAIVPFTTVGADDSSLDNVGNDTDTDVIQSLPGGQAA